MNEKSRRAPIAIKHRNAGRCGCGRPPKPGCKSCQICLTKARDATKARRKLPGHCRHCGRRSSVTICAVCKPRHLKSQARWRQNRKARGLCKSCPLPTEKPGASYCKSHSDRNRARARAYAATKRALTR